MTEEVFDGRSWQTEPALAGAMSEAFWRMRRVHELALGLALTQRLALDPERVRRRRELEAELDPPGGFSREKLEELALEAVTRSVRELLSGVRDLLASGDPSRRHLPLTASPAARNTPGACVSAARSGVSAGSASLQRG